MPADSIPAVALVVAMFVTFMITLGAVSIWANRSPNRNRSRDPGQTRH